MVSTKLLEHQSERSQESVTCLHISDERSIMAVTFATGAGRELAVQCASLPGSAVEETRPSKRPGFFLCEPQV